MTLYAKEQAYSFVGIEISDIRPSEFYVFSAFSSSLKCEIHALDAPYVAQKLFRGKSGLIWIIVFSKRDYARLKIVDRGNS